MKSITSLHVVRRYGLVGGMENYVWELTHALHELGQTVYVVCEQCLSPLKRDINVIEMGAIKPRPRWLSMLRFSRCITHAVARIVETSNPRTMVIHSHERTAVHDVTTFHGPLIVHRKKSWSDKISPRLIAWEYLEKRELAAKNVRCVIPNSMAVSEQLKQAYPQIAHLVTEPMHPGVATELPAIQSSSSGKTVGFIGREWKRKGLDFAVEIITELRKIDPEIRFIIAGCAESEVKHLFGHSLRHGSGGLGDSGNSGGIEISGWVEPLDFFARIDLLIHPARNEPFGMVIAEANAAGIPVVVSNRCGIASMIGEAQGKVLPLDDRNEWVASCYHYLNQPPAERQKIIPLPLSWITLAESHIELYTRVMLRRGE
ncbi:putative transferase [uncultured Candidatus Thioglobus sp.]|nr:putative transferase [uncultured Candidatus Thioglobus sp.]